MGCDIHIFVEKRNNDGAWQAVAGANPWIEMYRDWSKTQRLGGDLEKAFEYEKMADDIESGRRAKNDSDWEDQAPTVYKDWIYNGRNYRFFSLLADVRNDYDIVPISEPKGLPGDASDIVCHGADLWEYDGHSRSWLTLAELKAYDQTTPFTHTGVVKEEVYKAWKDGGSPYPCAGSVGGSRVVNVSNENMDALISGQFIRDPDKDYYTEISWKETIADTTSLNQVIEKMEALTNDASGEDIRIVFWFDN